MKVRTLQNLPTLRYLAFSNVLHSITYIISGPSLLIKSTDSMMLKNLPLQLPTHHQINCILVLQILDWIHYPSLGVQWPYTAPMLNIITS